jgi:hypothetical protein
MKIPTLIAMAMLLPGAAAAAKKAKAPVSPVPPPTSTPSTPIAPAPGGTATARVVALPAFRPVAMKLLVLAGDGNEPGFAAIRSTLDHMGVPYDAVIARNQPLPALASTDKGNYQGIILATGNLVFFDGAVYKSALDANGWATLDAYARDYRVRTVSYYTFPETRYGITFTGAQATSDASPLNASITAPGQPLFPYLKSGAAVRIANAYVYMASPSPAADETTTPIATVGTSTVGVLHSKADGREYLALTFDHNPNLRHSNLLNYGLINWVTRGVFLGSRRIYLSPQNDDLFLSSDLFVSNLPACQPVGAAADPTFDPAGACPVARMDDRDLQSVVDWQKRVRGQAQTRDFQLSMAFNGFGTTEESGAARGDRLTREAKEQSKQFFWVSHTYDHENLDCYNPVPNSSVCRGATYGESVFEIEENRKIARALRLAVDDVSMVTPGISGFNNPEFMRAAFDRGLRYLVTDTSRPGGLPAVPNTGIRSSLQPGILLIPRRATNIFYNVETPQVGAVGSEPDEYNFFFGPNGIFRIGGTNQPFFNTIQTYAQIIDREADALVTYMLRYEMYGAMFHQANYVRHTGARSLFTDLMDAVFAKFAAVCNLPVESLQQAEIGQKLKDRMAFLSSGASGVYTPGSGSITLTSPVTAKVPVTGACGGTCQTYGGQRQSEITVNAGSTVRVPVN